MVVLLTTGLSARFKKKSFLFYSLNLRKNHIFVDPGGMEESGHITNDIIDFIFLNLRRYLPQRIYRKQNKIYPIKATKEYFALV